VGPIYFKKDLRWKTQEDINPFAGFHVVGNGNQLPVVMRPPLEGLLWNISCLLIPRTLQDHMEDCDVDQNYEVEII
jgi:hypothetical protein